ncbi:MAG: carbohydrate binding family 9 domain-containing protein [Bacteroidetes bacterium]|nr:carbohydrate binding family 9 domain-containing protein [Bacteroidota bacterium]
MEICRAMSSTLQTIVKSTILLLCQFLAVHSLWSQDGMRFQEQYQVRISKTVSTIKIDGQLDEQVWKTAGQAGDFHMKWPNDVGRPTRKTFVKITHDDHFLYFGIIAEDTNYYVAQTLKRDQGIYMSDAISIAIDPVNQRTNGFLFSITPYNVQTEDLVNVGTPSEELNFSWDNKWYSATTRYPDRWTAEIAIPFHTFRFNEGHDKWGLNILRSDLKTNEYSSWTDMPLNFDFYDFGYSGVILWDKPPVSPGTNLSLIPYVTGSSTANREAGQTTSGKLNAGFDAKVALTSSLNLDLTLNPDFSQVEVDQQVTNLTRFDIFFPERRTFFLENSDLFANFGIPPIRPFYSRTIGLDRNANRIPIIGGARISGNLSKRTRVGLMNMQTKATSEYGAQNYTAVTLNQQVQKRSLLNGYFFNRQEVSPALDKPTEALDAYGRNAGLEYRFIEKSGKWNAWTGFHRSFKPTINSAEYYTNVGGGYFSKKLNFILDAGKLTDNYYADMGFVNRIANYDALLDTVIRKGFYILYNQTSYTFFPKSKLINQFMISLENVSFLNLDGRNNETDSDLEFSFFMKNTSNLVLHLHRNVNDLLYNTSFTDGKPIPPGHYGTYTYGATYSSDNRKKLSFTGDLEVGDFFNGSIFRYQLGANFRIQPWANFTMSIQQAKLQFPTPYGTNNLFLIAPRIEINFSNNLFWTTFLQYNNQQNNFNINSRLQWQYKPMSDIFLVYSDNYFTDPFLKNKNRALVFKMNYWFNL